MNNTEGQWRKSSYSNAQSACVEVSPGGETATVGARDTKHEERGPELWVPSTSWTAFLRLVADHR
ncbi:DUF397 domain-containing protein [Streptomyces sp. MS19]|uniref:DUF397 domain-containing protein n=1 Tax=Streptomyces sp. MS19 TaxID=3385972 RepID=UPI0039A2DB75